MEIKTLLFYFFAALLVFSALRVVTARNPVHAALFLVLSFFSAAGIWILLKAEFLAISLVLVYVGAVMVLFLFVVMMLDINIDRLRDSFWKQAPIAAILGAVLVLIGWVVALRFRNTDADLPAQAHVVGTTRELGKAIYTQYLYPVELAAVLLLIAIVAAIALTLRRRKDNKAQDVSEQVRVKRADRVELVKIPAKMPRTAVLQQNSEKIDPAPTGGKA